MTVGMLAGSKLGYHRTFNKASMAQKTFGRKPNQSQREYMDHIRKAPETLKRSFHQTDSSTDLFEECVVKKSVKQHQPNTIQPKDFYSTSSSHKRKRAMGDKEQGHDTKRHLRTPPVEADEDTQPQPKLSKKQKKRLNRRIKKLALTSAVVDKAEDTTTTRLPTPPPSIHEPSKSEEVEFAGESVSQSSFGQLGTERDENGIKIDDSIPIHANGSIIEGFSHDIVKNIISHILGGPRLIKPWFAKGQLYLGHRANALNDKSIVSFENIDLYILRTCKAFHKAGAELFYSENRFYFEEPGACS